MARFYSVTDAVDLALLGNDDTLKHDKGRLLKWSKHVWNDLNITTLKVAKRELFHINKRLNTVDLPCNFLQLSSVNVIDHNGVIYPIFRNDKIHDDIVDLSAAKDCACEYKCGYALCNLVKGYEAIVSTKSDFNPDGSPVSFTCVDRKAVDRNGFLYTETQFPERVYVSGVWVETILQTEMNKLCKCEVDHHGCLCDTEDNIKKVCDACGITNNQIPFGGDANTFYNNPHVNTWIYSCSSKMDWLGVQCGAFNKLNNCNNIYNITELGDRLIFPHNFGFDKVLVRYYEDINLENLQIPFEAVTTFVTGLKYFDSRWNDKRQQLASKYEADYVRQKWGLFLELNKYRISELRVMLTPPVLVPSYLDHRRDRTWDLFN